MKDSSAFYYGSKKGSAYLKMTCVIESPSLFVVRMWTNRFSSICGLYIVSIKKYNVTIAQEYSALSSTTNNQW